MKTRFELDVKVGKKFLCTLEYEISERVLFALGDLVEVGDRLIRKVVDKRFVLAANTWVIELEAIDCKNNPMSAELICTDLLDEGWQ